MKSKSINPQLILSHLRGAFQRLAVFSGQLYDRAIASQFWSKASSWLSSVSTKLFESSAWMNFSRFVSTSYSALDLTDRFKSMWVKVSQALANWEIPKRTLPVLQSLSGRFDERKIRACAVLTVTFSITFLTLVLLLKVVTQTNPAMARSDAWLNMFTTKRVEPYALQPQSDMWTPPSWYPKDEQKDLWVLPELEQDALDVRGPRLRSRAAFVFDLDRSEVLFAKNADIRWPVASLTKVISGLALASLDHDLDKEVCLDRTIYANFPGARTYFDHNECVSGWDLLGSALVRSDNGGAFALSTVADMPPTAFVEQMNAVASDLGMENSEFVDPAGVHDENLSTARDITRAIIAASNHPDLSMAVSAPHWYTQLNQKGKRLRLNTTNRFRGRARTEFLAAKTGYTNTALNCFSTVVQKDGRNFAITTMGAYRSKHRWADFERLLNWSMKQ